MEWVWIKHHNLMPSMEFLDCRVVGVYKGWSSNDALSCQKIQKRTAAEWNLVRENDKEH